jgi:hypothetical protein
MRLALCVARRWRGIHVSELDFVLVCFTKVIPKQAACLIDSSETKWCDWRSMTVRSKIIGWLGEERTSRGDDWTYKVGTNEISSDTVTVESK